MGSDAKNTPISQTDKAQRETKASARTALRKIRRTRRHDGKDGSVRLFRIRKKMLSQNRLADLDSEKSVEQKINGKIEVPERLPMLPVNDAVVFNYVVVPLGVNRASSVQAAEAAYAGKSKLIFLCTQRQNQRETLTKKDLYNVGTVAQVLRIVKAPDNHVKILVQGLLKARLLGLDRNGSFPVAKIRILPEKPVSLTTEQQSALLRFAKEQCEKMLNLRGLPSTEIMNLLNPVTNIGMLADMIAGNLKLDTDVSQKILQCTDPVRRLRSVLSHLMHETEVMSLQVRIQQETQESLSKTQREFFLREQIRTIRKELGESGDGTDEIEELKKTLKRLKLPEEVRREADKQVSRLANLHGDSAEAGVIRNYLDWIIDLPWHKKTEDRLDIAAAEKILEAGHCGLKKVKERILEYLSVRSLNAEAKGSILCLAGPPGVGKTSLGFSVAQALGRKVQRIALGGMKDEAEIRGHRRTYIGSMPGRILQAMKNAGTINPVIVLDEIDKLGNDFRGDPASALLEVLDPEQNSTFTDHYLNAPYDLSGVLFICTANHPETIPEALRDRLDIISISGYTQQEKKDIAKRHLIPRQAVENGIGHKHISFSDGALNTLLTRYTREAGVRNLERQIGAICRKIARNLAEKKPITGRVTTAAIGKYLGAPLFMQEQTDQKLIPGVAIGLAWTPAGGEILHIEVAAMEGKGQLLLTGQLGEVMKESAQAALTFIRSHSERIGLNAEIFQKTDLHVHVPAGAIPKDGPSAGVTLVTAMISSLTGRSVRHDLCMTGEISLRGRILPVGGIREKLLAGVAHGMKEAIIPAENARDLEEAAADLAGKIRVHTMSHIDDLLSSAFETPFCNNSLKG
ncbi:MAG: endopeptidase La [Desulfovibrionaceae bacterium]|nr:endopeptidase La [Desulfovibrionaceae bacterium]